MNAPSGGELVGVPCVSGMQRPRSWGHRFGAQLRCDWCSVPWSGHQDQPRPCAGERGRAGGPEGRAGVLRARAPFPALPSAPRVRN